MVIVPASDVDVAVLVVHGAQARSLPVHEFSLILSLARKILDAAAIWLVIFPVACECAFSIPGGASSMLDSHGVLALVKPVGLGHAPLSMHFVVKEVSLKVPPVCEGYFALSALFPVHELPGVHAAVCASESSEPVKLGFMKLALILALRLDGGKLASSFELVVLDLSCVNSVLVLHRDFPVHFAALEIADCNFAQVRAAAIAMGQIFLPRAFVEITVFVEATAKSFPHVV